MRSVTVSIHYPVGSLISVYQTERTTVR